MYTFSRYCALYARIKQQHPELYKKHFYALKMPKSQEERLKILRQTKFAFLLDVIKKRPEQREIILQLINALCFSNRPISQLTINAQSKLNGVI